MNQKKGILSKIFVNALTAYILADVATVIGPLVDSAIIANYLGVEAVAAVGLFSPFLMFIAIIGSVIAGGSRGLYTNLVGKGELEKANFVFTFSCIMAVTFAAVVSILGITFSDKIAIALGANGQNANLRPLLSSYVRGILMGITFLSTAKVMNGYMHLDHDSERTVYSLIVMTIVNILGDFVVTFVIKGDIFGIAVATSVGNLVWFLVLAGHFLRKDRTLRFNLCDLKNAAKYVKSIMLTGSNAAVTRLSKMFSGLLVNYMLAIYANAIAIAAYSVQKSVTSLLGCIYLGIADTVWVMSGIYYGEEDRTSLDEVQVFATKMGLKITVVIGVVLFIFAKYVAGVYIGFENAEALGYGIESVRMLALSMPIYVIIFSFANYLISVKMIRISNFYSFMMQFGTVVPTAYVLIRLIGARGAWISTPIASLLCLALTFIIIITYKIDSNDFHVKRLLVPIDFGMNKGREMEITADTLNEISGMSRIAGLFCKENNIDKVTANKLALCIEEIGTNIIEHGFKDKEPHSINMRVVVKDEEIILRIRDDCNPFNPLERYKMKTKNDKDPSKNIGIRMVMGMCNSVNYICTFNTNNLIMKIPVIKLAS